MEIYLPIAEMSVNVLLILSLGAAVGFLSGLFGIGGGFLMTPLLIFLGLPPAIAVATQSAQIAAASTTGALWAWRRQTLDVKLGFVLTAGGVGGALLGALFFNAMRRLGQLDLIISLSYMLLFGIVGALMLLESLRSVVSARRGLVRSRRRAGDHAWYLHLPGRCRFPRSRLYISVIPLLALGGVIGFAGSVMGIGGGFILLPALIYVLKMPSQRVVGTTQLHTLFTMTVVTVLHACLNATVDGVLAVLLIVGGVFGAQFGARAGRNLQGEFFRLLLALLVLSVSIRFALELVIKPRELFSVFITNASG